VSQFSGGERDRGEKVGATGPMGGGGKGDEKEKGDIFFERRGATGDWGVNGEGKKCLIESMWHHGRIRVGGYKSRGLKAGGGNSL